MGRAGRRNQSGHCAHVDERKADHGEVSLDVCGIGCSLDLIRREQQCSIRFCGIRHSDLSARPWFGRSVPARQVEIRHSGFWFLLQRDVGSAGRARAGRRGLRGWVVIPIARQCRRRAAARARLQQLAPQGLPADRAQGRSPTGPARLIRGAAGGGRATPCWRFSRRAGHSVGTCKRCYAKLFDDADPAGDVDPEDQILAVRARRQRCRAAVLRSPRAPARDVLYAGNRRCVGGCWLRATKGLLCRQGRKARLRTRTENLFITSEVLCQLS